MIKIPALSVRGLCRSFNSGGRRVLAVDNVSFDIARGETLGLAGPSGSGKSTVARLITRVIEAHSGQISLMGEDFGALDGAALRRRRRLLQMIFQDTTAAFSPRATVGAALEDPLRVHGIRTAAERPSRVAELLSMVGLDPSLSSCRAHELSGGQRQRVAIARALACEPSVLILDEALSAIDASRRVELVDLLIRLQQSEGLSCLFIAHDLGLIRAMSHRVAIMENGRIVETGPAVDVIDHPSSATGRALVEAAPRLELGS